jgi:TPP-dependent pyruvate/acetoin dehydrogenase alpha subunit
MRMQGHAQHDDARYVPRDMIEKWAAKDPIARYRHDLIEQSLATAEDLDDIDEMAKTYVAEEAGLAEASPMPDPATVARGVYAGDDFALPRIELVKSPFSTT